ncbi:hypothetical protein [Vibrio cincinnatiensis]|nr:hypothetical protein [Vibrio cincinnatiensis]
MQSANVQALESVDFSNQSEAVLTHIRQAFEDIAQVNHSITTASDQQASVAHQTKQSIHSLSGDTLELEQQAKQAREVSEVLSQASGELREKVHHFVTA